MRHFHFKKYVSVALVLILSLVTLLTGCGTTAEVPRNPLTGMTEEDGFDPEVLNQRIGAFVVENTPDARPQWGLDDPDYSPDMVLQGEVEGGITRTLWFYSDYTKMPAVIGPMRSARPPYVRFSELFDSIFIHWGMSKSKGKYVGANTVFKEDGVDHINRDTMDDKEGLFGRDETRSTSIEHRGQMYSDKLVASIENEGIRTEPEEYTKLYFYDEPTALSDKTAVKIDVKYSDRTYGQSTTWTYNDEEGTYHTSDFKNDFVRDNLLVLYDDTKYITKTGYGGTGGSVTYCDYKFKGGKAILFSRGTEKELKWLVRGGKLYLVDESVDLEDEEAIKENGTVIDKMPSADFDPEDEDAASEVEMVSYAPQALNKGKTWIGWISRNNGGSVDSTPGKVTMPEKSEE